MKLFSRSHLSLHCRHNCFQSFYAVFVLVTLCDEKTLWKKSKNYFTIYTCSYFPKFSEIMMQNNNGPFSTMETISRKCYGLIAAGNLESISIVVRKRRWRWLEHVLWMEADSPPRVALRWTHQGRRKRGRPKVTQPPDGQTISSSGIPRLVPLWVLSGSSYCSETLC